MTASDRPLSSKGNELCILALLCLALLGQVACQEGIYVDALVPAEHEVVGEDQYVCFRVDLPKQSLKIVGVDPLSTQDVVHHMLLFGTLAMAAARSSLHASCALQSGLAVASCKKMNADFMW